jgi:hypothetical protein
MYRILREPLLHFLLLGIGMFVVFAYLNPSSMDDPRRISVSRADLLTFMQYQARAIDGERLNIILDQLPEDKMQEVIDDYVREEVLYREAKSLGLDRYDYTAKRRLVQRMEYTLRDLVDSVDISQETLSKYYAQHQAAYYVESEITFTHVFISTKNRVPEAALLVAERTLQQLQQRRELFNHATSYGDRFLYHSNYIGKGAQAVLDHFGADFQQQVFALNEDTLNTWQGPILSEYGYHLVQVASIKKGYQPELKEVYARVMSDAQRYEQQKLLDGAIDVIVADYKIFMEKDGITSGSGLASQPVTVTLDAS